MHKTQVRMDQRPQYKASHTSIRIEEKVGSTLERIGTRDHFLNIIPAAQMGPPETEKLHTVNKTK